MAKVATRDTPTPGWTLFWSGTEKTDRETRSVALHM